MGKNSKRIKGKTLVLSDFLQENSGPSKPTTLRDTNLDSTAEVEDNCNQFDSQPKLNVALPTAPRASRGVDYNGEVPDQPPYIAYLSNLPYDVTEEDIAQLFGNLKISALKIPKEERPNEKPRSKGFGFVEFLDKDGLIGALNIPDCTLNSRQIRIEIATKSETEKRGRGGRMNNNRDRPDRPEVTSGNWRSEPRSEIVTNSESERRGKVGRMDNNRDRSVRPEILSGNWRREPRSDIAAKSESERLGGGGKMDNKRDRPDRPEVTSANWRSGPRSDIATNSESERRGRGRGGRMDNNRDRPDRPEVTSGNWRSEPRNNIATNSESGRRGRGGRMDNNHDRSVRPEVVSGNWCCERKSDSPPSEDRGSLDGLNRDRENEVADHGGSGVLDRGRFGDRNRFDRERPLVPRRNDRNGFSRRGSNRGNAETSGSGRSDGEARTRQKLNLLPRSVATSDTPVENEPPAVIQETNANISVPIASSIFGGARPVDTSATDKDTEDKLEKAKTTKDRSRGDWDSSEVKRKTSPKRRSPRRRSAMAVSPNRGSPRTSPRSDYSPQGDSPQLFSPRRTSPQSRRDYSSDNRNNASLNDSGESSIESPLSRRRSSTSRARSFSSRDPSVAYKRHSSERRHSLSETRIRP